MLKDLQERTPDLSNNEAMPVSVMQSKPSQLKLVAIVVIILLCNAAGLYIWFLLDENKTLKSEAVELQTIAKIPLDRPFEVSSINKGEKLSDNNTAEADVLVLQQNSNEKVLPKASAADTQISSLANSSAKTQLTTTQLDNVKNQTQPKLNKQVNDSLDEESKSVVAKTPSKEKPIVLAQPTPEPAKMSVTSRKFTAAELVEQKLAQAETAISRNNIAKAEQLFEDVLIVEPTHSKTRKKLAALWFGREAWQEAENLLSQGIAMAPKDSELRMMQAKVFIKQSKYSSAYQVLRPLALLENIEYQIQLANTAQKISEHSGAITAYKLLIKMQPSKARWYLGLAIVYDQSSQFSLAISQYELALKRGDLSLDSKNFAQQRIQALGE
jgi:MSHA biogenesis protein MshN